MTTCVILLKFPLCSQNGSDLSRYGLKTSEGVLWCLAPGRIKWILWVLYVWGWGFHGSDLVITFYRSDWDLENLEARSTPGALYCVPQTVLE